MEGREAGLPAQCGRRILLPTQSWPPWSRRRSWGRHMQRHSLELEFITLGLHIGQVSKSVGKVKFTFSHCLTYIERRPPNQLPTLYELWPIHLFQIVSYFCISKESNFFHRLRGVGTVLSPLFPAYCATHFRAISSLGHLPFLYTFPSV